MVELEKIIKKDNRPLFIAEVKTLSPFGFKSNKTWEELFELACNVGDIVSIHTDPLWGGSFELLAKARDLTSKPILAKGIHKTDAEVERALATGANWVLVVGRVPKIFPERCLIEPNSLSELAALDKKLHAVWNSRNLKTGGLKKETFEEARKVFSGWLCQASNIKMKKDIQDGADAVLVGTNLDTFIF